jgi:hypothetical protein
MAFGCLSGLVIDGIDENVRVKEVIAGIVEMREDIALGTEHLASFVVPEYGTTRCGDSIQYPLLY